MNPKLYGGNIFMKKLAACSVIFLLILQMMGCSGKFKHIDISDITGSTMLARANGELQVATVEDFSKSYYDLKELQNFIDKEIASYNKSAGADSITADKVEKQDHKAIMLLTYKGMKDYATFNKVTAAYFNGGVKDNTLNLPSTLVNAKSKALASTDEILQNDKLKILVLNEPYHIIVDGKVKYYSDNATLINDKEVQGADKGMTIVVYKH
jgi:hypothetical protein